MEDRKREQKPLPAPDMERHASDRERGYGTPASDPDEETPTRPAPDVEHHPEPDAENIMPAEDKPGTF
ncbi:MAG TPA: hypothetical protein VK928_06440 [Longimicrobiales bacterium]|nr:hypothetical protein [Longimicrobiales bacterium]